MSLDLLGRGKAMLDRWVAAQGMSLVRSELCLLFKGPYSFWRSSESQPVFQITVRTADGAEKSGYARCGGWFLGTWTEEVDVTWDAQGISSQ